MSNLKRSKDWRALLDDLMERQGVDLQYVADYIGAPYNGTETVFYAKLPKKRVRFIGIGMALSQPLDVINGWIREYSNHHALYVKDVAEDLIWIYLIGLNQANPGNGINYFQSFEECQEAVLLTYRQLWDEFTLGSLDTSDLEIRLQKINYDDTFTGLREFIVEHMDSFKTAYTKPRRMLERYLDCILKQDGEGPQRTLNSLRGNLDDSMINYLSGSSDTIHTMDHRKPVRLVGFKPIPKNRKTHISLCLALGMTRSEIDRYLTMMGYGPLRDKGDEGTLIRMLTDWEKKKPLQRAFKEAYFNEEQQTPFPSAQKQNAVQEMLDLRRDLQFEYKKQGLTFPYG